MALIFFTLLFISIFITQTEENTLLVVEKQSECGPNSPQQCVRAAIIRGQTSIGLPAICYNRVDPGPCGRDLVRVYYDWKSNHCKHFSYSGCGGNANIFISIKNCYHICNPGYRTRIVETTPPPNPIMVVAGQTVTTAKATCPTPSPRKKVKLNVTQVQQIEVEM